MTKIDGVFLWTNLTQGLLIKAEVYKIISMEELSVEINQVKTIY